MRFGAETEAQALSALEFSSCLMNVTSGVTCADPWQGRTASSGAAGATAHANGKPVEKPQNPLLICFTFFSNGFFYICSISHQPSVTLMLGRIQYLLV